MELPPHAVQGPAPLGAPLRAQTWLPHAQGPALVLRVLLSTGRSEPLAAGTGLPPPRHWGIVLPPPVTQIQQEIHGAKFDKHSSHFKKQVVPGILQ